MNPLSFNLAHIINSSLLRINSDHHLCFPINNKNSTKAVVTLPSINTCTFVGKSIIGYICEAINCHWSLLLTSVLIGCACGSCDWLWFGERVLSLAVAVGWMSVRDGLDGLFGNQTGVWEDWCGGAEQTEGAQNSWRETHDTSVTIKLILPDRSDSISDWISRFCCCTMQINNSDRCLATNFT